MVAEPTELVRAFAGDEVGKGRVGDGISPAGKHLVVPEWEKPAPIWFSVPEMSMPG